MIKVFCRNDEVYCPSCKNKLDVKIFHSTSLFIKECNCCNFCFYNQSNDYISIKYKSKKIDINVHYNFYILSKIDNGIEYAYDYEFAQTMFGEFCLNIKHLNKYINLLIKLEENSVFE